RVAPRAGRVPWNPADPKVVPADRRHSRFLLWAGASTGTGPASAYAQSPIPLVPFPVAAVGGASDARGDARTRPRVQRDAIVDNPVRVEAHMKRAALFVWLLPMIAGPSSPVHRATSADPRILEVGQLGTERIRALDRAHTVVLLQGGILEEHGPYLPCFSDGYQSDFIATKVAAAIVARPGWTVLRFPSLPLGAMPANELGGRFSFPGSYAVRAATLRAVFMDLATDLGEAGFRYVLVVNYHGGPTHVRALDEASRYFS